jgi:hypothetical protein
MLFKRGRPEARHGFESGLVPGVLPARKSLVNKPVELGYR